MNTENVVNEMTEGQPDNISAFAYNTGRLVEHIINSTTDNLIEDNRLLKARILNFRSKLVPINEEKDPIRRLLLEQFDKDFAIEQF